MGLHIEISSDCTPREWRAIAALTAVMLGTTSPAAIAGDVDHGKPFEPGPSKRPDDFPEGGVALVAIPDHHEIGIDADRPKVPPVPGAVVPPVPGIVPLPPTADAPVTSAPAGVELDARGLPWDIRIHASTKGKTKKDEWTAKRGVDANLVKHVEDELRKTMSAPVPDAVVPAPPVADGLDPAAAFGGTPSTPADVPPPPTDAVAAAPMAEFARVMRLVTARQAAGTLATEVVTTIAQSLGIAGVVDLSKRPDLIPAFEALLP